jgi:hypothetical protein
MKLSPNFTLKELTATDTGIENEPLSIERDKLLYLAWYILQPIRDMWGRIRVTSGFRSVPVNIRVGGSPSSQHLFGEAADIQPLDVDLDTVFDWIVRTLTFGQAILEQRGEDWWIHISLPRLNKPNQQALIYDGVEYKPYY